MKYLIFIVCLITLLCCSDGPGNYYVIPEVDGGEDASVDSAWAIGGGYTSNVRCVREQ